ncbi:hypothetical protein M8J75_011879 [Diaphorina citri]|nr:hypothetical protein M8J75_011879 [Diaphorina citri]
MLESKSQCRRGNGNKHEKVTALHDYARQRSYHARPGRNRDASSVRCCPVRNSKHREKSNHQSARGDHSRGRRNTKRERSLTPVQSRVGLMTKMFSYLPSWLRQGNTPRSETPRHSQCGDCSVLSQDFVYSDEEQLIKAKKQMLEAEKKARKLKEQKIKNRKETYKRYKMKAREIEKQVQHMEKEKMKQKQEALRLAHRMERERLLRDRQLLREKERLERLELRNREKNVVNHMKSLKRKLRAKCESIYYDSEETSGELSELSSIERVPRYSKHRSRSSHGRDDCNTRHSSKNNRTDEDVARILNALLDTNIQFDPDIIARIKTLLKNNAKMQGYFDEVRRNNLAHQIKYKLFNRIGPDSKLKLFLNSKKKCNLDNKENRELVQCIMDQVNKGGGNVSGDTTLEKICRILWKSRGEPQATSSNPTLTPDPTPPNTSACTDKTVCYRADTGTHANKPRKTHTGEDKHAKTKPHKTHGDKLDRKSLRPVNSLELTKKKLWQSDDKSHRRQRLGHKVKKCRLKPFTEAPSNTSIRPGRPFLLDKARVNTILASRPQPYSDESDLEEEELQDHRLDSATQPGDPEETRAPPRFSLWRYFQKPAAVQTPERDSIRNLERDSVRSVKTHEKRCDRCDKATETDAELSSGSEYEYELDGDVGKRQRKAKLWTLFNKKNKGSGDFGRDRRCVDTNEERQSRQRRKTVWTNK